MIDRADEDDLTRALAEAYGRGQGIGDVKANTVAGSSQNRTARPRYAFPKGFFTNEFRWGFLVGRFAKSGKPYHAWLNWFDFTHGNEHFFDLDDPTRIKLRPLISSDRLNPRRSECMSSCWFGGDVNSLLWADHPEGSGATAFLVHLFPRGDCEDPKNVARAICHARHQYGTSYPAAVALLT
ncbi:hypothetical protein [Methylobacterium persicinum]|uniref:Uncharacterized protein n=1 Tax=Methylobacterium persicinum TaxID=374426 RepID=A0ABU0HSV0_9HYPH|nr:hypothetical protein [Methylobacterium persicinum]MDQ0444551.1 hypothetical protein [Methylobacterium persicinum]GJE40447.1 hypothetical protein KHHGKMAE_4540 [Methylobacterium persicinum]